MRVGQREVQRRHRFGFQPAVAFQHTPLFDGAHLAADQHQRQLVGQQLVISQALALGCQGLQIFFVHRRMDFADRVGKRRPAARLQIGRVEPFRHRRDFLHRAADRLAQHLACQPFGQGIDRLVQRHILARRRDDIGMRHLQAIVEALDAARNDALAAHRKRFVQPIGMSVEEHQLDRRGVVGAAHFVRLALITRGDVVHHIDRHGGDAARLGPDQLGAVGAVDHPGRQVEDEVLQPRPGNLGDQFLQPRTDARQRAGLGEQRKQNRRAHG